MLCLKNKCIVVIIATIIIAIIIIITIVPSGFIEINCSVGQAHILVVVVRQ